MFADGGAQLPLSSAAEDGYGTFGHSPVFYFPDRLETAPRRHAMLFRGLLG